MSKKRLYHVFWFSYLGLMFGYLLFINFHTPLIGEDYAFLIYTNNKVDLAKNTFYHFIDFFNYNSSTRFNQRIGDQLASLLLNGGNLLGIGKSLFNIMNSIVIILFFFIIFFFSNCRLPNINSIKDLAVFSTIPIFFLICSFSIGEIFFWCDGTTNYLWAGTILLAVAIPYRKYLNNNEYIIKNSRIFGYVIISYIAGFTTENSVPIIILLGGFLILRDFIKGGIKKIPIWLLLSVLSMGIGYSILLFSPNTKRRTMVYRNMFNLPENISLREVKNNIIRVMHTFFSSNYRFLIIFFLSIIIFFLIFRILEIKIYKNNQKKLIVINNYNSLMELFENVFILLLSSISIIALFFAPYTEIRTFLFVQICIILVNVRMNYISLCIINFKKNKYFMYLPNIFFCLLSIIFLYRLSAWSLDYSKFDRLRSESIKKQIADGKETVIVKMYPIERNKYLNTREVWLQDVEYSGAGCYARFYGANNIQWNLFSYEEETMETTKINQIYIPRNVSEIQTHDIISIKFFNDNLIVYCGIDDPQVYLSLQEPIKKLSDEIFMEIEYANSKAGNFQIYYDFGNGLSEENSVRKNITEVQEITKLRLPIIGWKTGAYLYSIRVDPPDGTEFEIKSIEFGDKKR